MKNNSSLTPFGGRAVEDWLRQGVGPAFDALKADPARAVGADKVRATLAAEHKKATAKEA